MSRFFRASLTACLFLAAGAFAARAETMKFSADLAGTSEVPATTSPGKGEVSVQYDSATKMLSWKGTYSGLTGAASAAHFHGPAEAGKNAGVAVPAPAAASPFEGSAALTDAQAADLAAGKIYFNLHTAANPGGEIRGQVMPVK